MDEKFKCCLCGKIILGWGNNPWPLKDEGECCNNCNTYKVIPARLEQMTGKEKNDGE